MLAWGGGERAPGCSTSDRTGSTPVDGFGRAVAMERSAQAWQVAVSAVWLVLVWGVLASSATQCLPCTCNSTPLQLVDCPNEVFLALSQKNIHTLSHMAFTKSTLVIHLELSHNQIQTLPEGIFSSNVNMNNLEADGNRIQSLPAGIFKSNRVLTRVSFSDNSIQTLPSGIFDANTDLEEVWFANNLVQQLPTTIFAKNLRLSRVSFKNNKLQVLQTTLFYRNPMLKIVDVSGNPVLMTPSRACGLPSHLANKRIQQYRAMLNSKCPGVSASICLTGGYSCSCPDGFYYNGGRCEMFGGCHVHDRECKIFPNCTLDTSVNSSAFGVVRKCVCPASTFLIPHPCPNEASTPLAKLATSCTQNMNFDFVCVCSPLALGEFCKVPTVAPQTSQPQSTTQPPTQPSTSHVQSSTSAVTTSGNGGSGGGKPALPRSTAAPTTVTVQEKSASAVTTSGNGGSGGGKPALPRSTAAPTVQEKSASAVTTSGNGGSGGGKPALPQFTAASTVQEKSGSAVTTSGNGGSNGGKPALPRSTAAPTTVTVQEKTDDLPNSSHQTSAVLIGGVVGGIILLCIIFVFAVIYRRQSYSVDGKGTSLSMGAAHALLELRRWSVQSTDEDKKTGDPPTRVFKRRDSTTSDLSFVDGPNSIMALQLKKALSERAEPENPVGVDMTAAYASLQQSQSASSQQPRSITVPLGGPQRLNYPRVEPMARGNTVEEVDHIYDDDDIAKDTGPGQDDYSLTDEGTARYCSHPVLPRKPGHIVAMLPPKSAQLQR